MGKKELLKEIATRRYRVECSEDVNEIEELDTLLQSLQDVLKSQLTVYLYTYDCRIVMLFPFTKFQLRGDTKMVKFTYVFVQ